MSPTPFKQQITQLLSELNRCHELCMAIRQNRKLGPTTDALDNLQSTLASDASSIQTSFVTLRKLLGSHMDLGDDSSRNALNRSIREVQSEIEPKLADIAYKRREKGETEVPGFRELTRKWKKIEESVDSTLEALGQRIEESKSTPPPKQHKTEPKPEKKSQQKPIQHKTDEVVISLKELDHLLEHMKNSWVEKSVAGKVLYVNCFDDKRSQWEKPEGFIRPLPVKTTKPTRVPTWEQQEQETGRRRTAREEERAWEERERQEREQRPRREQVRGDFWDSPHGW
jgi:hypothetical protein